MAPLVQTIQNMLEVRKLLVSRDDDSDDDEDNYPRRKKLPKELDTPLLPLPDKSSSEDQLPPEYQFTSEDRFLPEGKFPSEDRFLPEGKFSSEDRFLPEEKLSSDEQFLPEEKFSSEDRFLPEGKFPPEDRFLPEEKFSSEDRFLPEEKLSSDEQFPSKDPNEDSPPSRSPPPLEPRPQLEPQPGKPQPPSPPLPPPPPQVVTVISTTTKTASPSAPTLAPTPNDLNPGMNPSMYQTNPSTQADAPRKELNPGQMPSTPAKVTPAAMGPSHSIQTIVIAQTGSASLNAPPVLVHHEHHEGVLSTTAEHILIAVGAIGAFIIFVALFYFFMVIRRQNKLLNPVVPSMNKDSNTRLEPVNMNEPPPQYSIDKNSPPIYLETSDQKSRLEYTTPAQYTGSTELSQLRPNDPSLSVSANPNPYESPIAQSRLGNSSQINTAFSTQQTPISNSTDPRNSYYPSISNNNNLMSQNVYTTLQTPDMYSYRQGQADRMSFRSSLSSGFGDGLIIPEPSVIGSGLKKPQRQSVLRNQAEQHARFSWVPSQPRDTMYSTISVDPSPRFRTVNSWVVQQSDRVERQVSTDRNIAYLPAAPLPARIAEERISSEESAFTRP